LIIGVAAHAPVGLETVEPKAAAPAVISPALIKFLRVIALFFIISSFRLVACSFSNRLLETLTPLIIKC
jgi:hypothetical protein